MSVDDELPEPEERKAQGPTSEEGPDAEKATRLDGETEAAPAAPDSPAPPTATPPERSGDESRGVITTIVVGGLVFFGLVALIVGIPAFIKYQRRAKTAEAITQMDKIYKSSAIYYTTPYIDSSDTRLPCQFPHNQGVTPFEGTCCTTEGSAGADKDGDDRCDANPTLWATDTWSAVDFQMTDAHYFVYTYESSGVLVDAGFTVTANADLDCDGIKSTFQRMGFGDPRASLTRCPLRGSAVFYVEHETE